MHKPSIAPWLSWALIFLLGVIWGSSYILIKKGLVAFSAEQLASLRIAISMLAFLPFLFWRYQRIDWSKWKYYALIGLTGNFFPAFLFAFAQTQISSSVTGVLSSLTPLFTLLLGLVFFGVVFSWNKTLAVAIGLAGAVMLILYGSESEESSHYGYAVLVIVATLLYATSVNIVKSYLNEVNATDMSIASFLIVGPPGVFYLFQTDFVEVLATHESGWLSLGYIAILAVVGTVVASVLFYRLVQLTSPVFATMVSYLVPMVALFWGFADGEPISIFHFIGMGLILTGVYISRRE